ncbi:UNVERIFIED_CONTAM: Splicing factor 3B subunit [Sesamum radiatum]|uniref:Splicing factor 3B subunit n=1 Tax=Sesamum radiatum TaxID=300843 RepID=A0AAW2TJJ5_SESRA
MEPVYIFEDCQSPIGLSLSRDRVAAWPCGLLVYGCEDALVHLMNNVWPNIIETSPHVINAVTEAIEGMRLALGAAIVLELLSSDFRDCSIQQGRSEKCTRKSIIFSISLYIGEQGALLAAYPVLQCEENNVFCRLELHMFV